MTRRTPLYLSLALSGLILAACGENTTPAEPETGENQSMTASLLAAASNSWTTKATLPGPTELYGYDVGVIPNSAGQSIVYALGGTDGEGGSGFPVQAYNVATNTWTMKSSNVYVFNSNGVGKIGKKLYFSGGYDYGGGSLDIHSTLYAYDPATDRMIRKADMPLHTADGVTGVVDGKLYVLPGVCSGDLWPYPGYCENEPIRKLFRYDPASDTWSGLRYSPHFHRSAAGGVINGKFYVAGGLNGFTPVADLDVYDVATNTWSTRAPLPTAGAAIGAVLGGKFYVISMGGSELHTYVYNPGTNTWQTKAAPTTGPGAVARVTLDAHAYLFAVGHPSELYTP
jgi:N-acetylneuraminic acid mutarotase